MAVYPGRNYWDGGISKGSCLNLSARIEETVWEIYNVPKTSGNGV